MKPLLGWTIAGAVAPTVYSSALILGAALVAPAAAVQHVDELPMALGALLFLAAVTVVPGALAGAVVGIVDAVLRHRLVQLERAERRRPALGSAAVVLLLAAVYGLLMMGVTPSDWSNLAANVGISLTLALVPAAVSLRLYLRLPHEPDRPESSRPPEPGQGGPEIER
ncbi:hypothetical protein BCE75_103285 [Isoptericola sp. CG 20/1183]|uniref:Secreted protein n=1 Tax=Isoptericola halotolerans TaxID=300560 RepID=A0ABX5EG87_9MICO|nr:MULTISPECIES: hypothetical protein [Isoptericola]PRZ08356.1 hypothetical protein BCL65_103286 [Isoptericola halotolerans]PRZ09153.1 hypothetical protein BCE75_103285 [Isoptericola sp. CG 20/1183]